jgi:hypothetical protein
MKEEKKFNVVPAYGSLFVTAQRPSATKSGIISNVLLDYLEDQRVITVGPECPSWVKENDIVRLDITHFEKLAYQKDSIKVDINGNHVKEYVFPLEEISGQEVMRINARDIKWVVQINDEHYKSE